MGLMPDPLPGPPTVRWMTVDDLPRVDAIETAAYAAGWPPTAFEQELAGNKLARYVVVEDGGDLFGFAGLWLMVDQAHVVTVAVDPPMRRRGLGRLLVHALLVVAMEEGMESATLEVRDSNAAAQALYRAYGFYPVGVRKRYYSDNGEDAVIMTTEAFATDAYQRRFTGLATELGGRFPGVSPRPTGRGPAHGAGA